MTDQPGPTSSDGSTRGAPSPGSTYGESSRTPGYGAWGVPSGQASQGPAPTCPRHPGVVSYVRCQRCDRPACPQCQRPAPVGVRCVDCARAAQSTTRVTRTVAGAKARPGKPVLTYGIIAINVLVFLLVSATNYERALMFVPVIGHEEPWRFLTSAFLHLEVWHIFLNMYALYVTGPTLEAVLGRWRFLSLYLLSALAGSAAVLALADPTGGMSWFTGVLGASGAVFGLFGAMAVTMRRLKRAEQGILVVIAINVVLGFVVPGIAWQAHIGGLVAGTAMAALYLFGPKKNRMLVAVAGTVLMAAAIVALVLWKYASVGLI